MLQNPIALVSRHFQKLLLKDIKLIPELTDLIFLTKKMQLVPVERGSKFKVVEAKSTAYISGKGFV